MKALLLACTLIAASPALASAQDMPESAWDATVETMSSALACNLITIDQMHLAMGYVLDRGFPDQMMPGVYAIDVPQYSAAGRDDAARPGFCPAFDPQQLQSIKDMARAHAAGLT